MTDTTSAVERVVATVAQTASDIHHGLVDRRVTADGENPSGETQFEADVFADELLADQLSSIDGVAQYASEERADPVDFAPDGLAVAADPVDGTSNLPSNNTMGTVFGIYDASLPAPGTALVAAGYVLYGPLTTMMVAHDGTVTEYALVDGDRTVIRDDVTIPATPTVYGFGGRVPTWIDDFHEFARGIETDDELALECHYSGAMINDVNQVLTKGGIFAYPALENSPNGKLRLQFEGNPIGYIIETAGGRSSDGSRSILDVEPTDLHDRVPLHVGNPELVERLEAAIG
ncbi:fructose-1,6-bisphosphatase (plasmid) [Natrialba magadii ATCC 43099]|uniref:Fructose-1,6-bisphosphatase class 1 n=1 Tax=Natrialba magadii (strain ATCC 43099 / DSM 3394 / CCM 3739 / CIP 104546 / IAM 13178 / JCM 8861 / NBRC 102185 / NCIMB 2190 / MS3) TaxID=547559 RepID=D3T1A9_NATMM|nr:fructose-bisphosphatase class I [Natrialba magadii]ADD07368.1 fructose-1,6-bisphosphatase [Natrialba magadii ATCC 43099]ELY32438.1 fructose-1,6-bisphosphatase [Natrialba magadii ATCC 43099]